MLLQLTIEGDDYLKLTFGCEMLEWYYFQLSHRRWIYSRANKDFMLRRGVYQEV